MEWLSRPDESYPPRFVIRRILFLVLHPLPLSALLYTLKSRILEGLTRFRP